MIDIRVTELEKFLLCPFHYKYPKEFDTKNVDFGTLMHEVITEYLRNKTEETYEMLRERISEKQYPPILYDHLYLARSLPEQQMDNIAVERYITVNGVEFYLHGTIDLAQDEKTLSDIKTSKGRRDDWTLRKKIQWVVYSWLYGKNDTFFYYIFTKHKKPQLQIIEEKIDNIANEIKVMSRLQQYTESYLDDERPCTKHVFCR